MRNAWKLFEYKGTPVYLKYWFLAIPLFLDIYLAISIFIAILVHELAHARVAKKLGYPVKKVFIDLLVGGAEVHESYLNNDKDCMKMVAAGPLSNFLLAIIGLFLGAFTVPIASPILTNFVASFILVNLVLGIFNLLPIYPMDGGRIFKSSLNLMTKSKTKSKLITGITSGIFSVALFAYSIFSKDWLLGGFSLLFIFISYNQIKNYKKLDT